MSDAPESPRTGIHASHWIEPRAVASLLIDPSPPVPSSLAGDEQDAGRADKESGRGAVVPGSPQRRPDADGLQVQASRGVSAGVRSWVLALASPAWRAQYRNDMLPLVLTAQGRSSELPGQQANGLGVQVAVIAVPVSRSKSMHDPSVIPIATRAWVPCTQNDRVRCLPAGRKDAHTSSLAGWRIGCAVRGDRSRKQVRGLLWARTLQPGQVLPLVCGTVLLHGRRSVLRSIACRIGTRPLLALVRLRLDDHRKKEQVRGRWIGITRSSGDYVQVSIRVQG